MLGVTLINVSNCAYGNQSHIRWCGSLFLSCVSVDALGPVPRKSDQDQPRSRSHDPRIKKCVPRNKISKDQISIVLKRFEGLSLAEEPNVTKRYYGAHSHDECIFENFVLLNTKSIKTSYD